MVTGESVGVPRDNGFGLDDRKAAILRVVVGEYIDTAQPVGSAHVARIPGLGVSPATVRNEMARLEAEGFLAHPHTSAGRIPTDKGYRFFVDQCRARPDVLARDQARQVADFFARTSGQLSRMLADTSRLLAGLTHYAALVVAPRHDAVVRSVQLVGLGPEPSASASATSQARVALAVVVHSDGSVDKANIELTAGSLGAGDIDGVLGDSRLATVSARLTAHFRGSRLVEVGILDSSNDPVTDAIAAQARAAILEAHSQEADEVFVGGTSQMAATFDAVDTLRQVLALLEEQYMVVALVREALQGEGLAVTIGSENGISSLAECSIVAAPYEVEGIRVGTIGVLGPTRMNYGQAMAAVAAVSDRLGHHLRDH